MDPSNPWAEQQGNGPPSNNTPQYQPPQQSQYGDQQPHQSFGQPQQYGDPHQHPLQQHPPQDQFSSQYPSQQGGAGGLGASDGAGGFGSGLGGAGTGLGGNDGFEAPPGLPPRRSATEQALPQGQDHSHQVEVMQSYEMSREQTEDEQNQSILQREFPKIDSSLIAAIYGDSGSLSATREMLQELSSGDGGQ